MSEKQALLVQGKGGNYTCQKYVIIQVAKQEVAITVPMR